MQLSKSKNRIGEIQVAIIPFIEIVCTAGKDRVEVVGRDDAEVLERLNDYIRRNSLRPSPFTTMEQLDVSFGYEVKYYGTTRKTITREQFLEISQPKKNEMGFVVVRDFVPRTTTNGINYSFDSCFAGKSVMIPMQNEENNFTNQLYASTRSEGLSYAFVNHIGTDLFIKRMKEKLTDLTGMSFNGVLQEYALPIFQYDNGGKIKAHKDIEKTNSTIKFQDYICVLMLTQRGEDFAGGRFYINPVATHSPDGKEVYNDLPKDRIYPKLNRGDIIIFNNNNYVHGVEETNVVGNQVGRRTCSLRTT